MRNCALERVRRCLSEEERHNQKEAKRKTNIVYRMRTRKIGAWVGGWAERHR